MSEATQKLLSTTAADQLEDLIKRWKIHARIQIHSGRSKALNVCIRDLERFLKDCDRSNQ